MKIIIRNPCTKKLSNHNFCSTCNHQIPDLSALSKSEALNKISTENITCAIFSKDQLTATNPLKNIYNIIAISAASLLIPQVNAQQYEVKNSLNTKQTINIKTKEIIFRIEADNPQNDETYRVLINDKLILDDLKANQDYIIKFDIENNSEIEIRVASNQFPGNFSVIYPSNQLPKKVVYNKNQIVLKPIIMGKIAVKRN